MLTNVSATIHLHSMRAQKKLKACRRDCGRSAENGDGGRESPDRPKHYDWLHASKEVWPLKIDLLPCLVQVT